MKPLILDCSVAMAWCFHDESTDYTDKVLDYVRHHSALVPPLWLSEVTNVLGMAVVKQRMDIGGGLEFLEKISRLPIRIASISSKEYFTGVFKLALDEKLTSYDSIYLYLAKREKKPLATIDEDLRKAGKRAGLPKFG